MYRVSTLRAQRRLSLLSATREAHSFHRWSRAVTLVLAVAIAAVGCSSGNVPEAERLAHEINQSVMCPVCPGESIDQSSHPLSAQMRAIVAEKIAEGWTAEQIKQYFVEGYGPSVLLEPPRSGFNLLVWVVPPLVVLMAGLLLYMVLRLMLRSRPEAGPVVMTENERASFISRIEGELGHESAARMEQERPAPGSKEGKST